MSEPLLKIENLHAVIAEDGLRLVSCGAPKLTRGSDRRLGARYQPRDERGRFVTYWVLSHEIQNDPRVIEAYLGGGE